MKTESRGREFRSIWFLLLGFCVAAAGVLILCINFSAALPDTIGRKLTEEEKTEVIGNNSSLIDYIYLSPNADFPRGSEIRKITIHHMAGDLALEDLGRPFPEGTGGHPPIMPLIRRAEWRCMWKKKIVPGLPAAGKMMIRQ